MQIIQISPGSGDNFYCENCLRDNVAVPALRRLGHDVIVVPLYLPLSGDHVDAAVKTPVFFGGINVWLQQKLGFFRHTPRWLDTLFDTRWLLRWAGQKSGMTDSRDLGKTLLSMLRGEYGHQRKELERLIDYLAEYEHPDLIVLGSVLLVGMAPRIRERLGVPMVCVLQGEGGFVDSALPDLAAQCWETMQQACRAVDGFITVSAWYRDHMAPRLGLDIATVRVVHVGLDPTGYVPAPSPPDPPTLGYLSRLCADRGLDLLVDAFIALKRQPACTAARLLLAGGKLPADEPFVAEQLRKLRDAGYADACEIVADFGVDGRQTFLQRVSVLSVPERVPEGFGLFLIEAAAAGIPVVQPETGPYPEIIAKTGGGLLCRLDDPKDLAAKVGELLGDPRYARAMGMAAREKVLQRCTDAVMAEELVAAYKAIRDASTAKPCR